MKSFGQQRAAARPGRSAASFDDDDDDAIEDSGFLTDDGSSIDLPDKVERRNSTLMLAEFLSTTGPEEFTKSSKRESQQIRRASGLLSRLRKRPTLPTIPTLRTQSIEEEEGATTTSFGLASPRTPTSHTTPMMAPTTPKRANYIPLPVYQPVLSHQMSSSNSVSQLRDSGVYSEASEKENAPPPVPTNSAIHELHASIPPPSPNPSLPGKQTSRQPRRPTPLPPALASAAIAAACRTPSASTPTSSRAMSTCSNLSDRSVLRSVPAAALKRRSVRLRQAQMQTPTQFEMPRDEPLCENRSTRTCPHCRQSSSASDAKAERQRRLSSPPALASGPKVQKEAQSLLAMIEQLKQQLARGAAIRRKLNWP